MLRLGWRGKLPFRKTYSPADSPPRGANILDRNSLKLLVTGAGLEPAGGEPRGILRGSERLPLSAVIQVIAFAKNPFLLEIFKSP
jgi:hypothetical protein